MNEHMNRQCLTGLVSWERNDDLAGGSRRICILIQMQMSMLIMAVSGLEMENYEIGVVV